MPVRLIFRCHTCRRQPDQLTQISIERQLLHFRFGQYVDAGPGGWLIWHGRGPYGPTLYSCGEHRAELRAYLRKHYAGPQASSRCTYPSLPPDDPALARRRARYQGWASPIPPQAQDAIGLTSISDHKVRLAPTVARADAIERAPGNCKYVAVTGSDWNPTAERAQ